MALGAPGSDVRRLIVADTLRVALLGIAGGLLLTLAVGRTLTALLYGVSPADPFTLTVVAAILVGTAALAGWLPARRALGNDPLRALRG
jgi:ABC-type antimicrobial peptide transport system permease subunit